MSGFLKSIGKVFKKIVKSPIFKVVAIAAAVYFTGGLALGAMGGAVLPGIGAVAETLGITAGSFGAAATGAAELAGAGMAAVGAEAEAVTAGLAGTGSGFAAEGAAGAAGAMEAAAPMATAAEGAAGGAGGWSGFGVNGSAALNAGTAPGYAFANPAAAGGSFATGGAPSASSFMDWLNKPGMAQKMVMEGLSQGGKALFSGISQKNQQDFYQKQIDDQKNDVIRKGQVPDISGVFSANKSGYKTPGIVNNAVASPTTPTPSSGA